MKFTQSHSLSPPHQPIRCCRPHLVLACCAAFCSIATVHPRFFSTAQPAPTAPCRFLGYRVHLAAPPKQDCRTTALTQPTAQQIPENAGIVMDIRPTNQTQQAMPRTLRMPCAKACLQCLWHARHACTAARSTNKHQLSGQPPTASHKPEPCDEKLHAEGAAPCMQLTSKYPADSNRALQLPALAKQLVMQLYSSCLLYTSPSPRD